MPIVGGVGGPVGLGGKLAKPYPLFYRFTCNGPGRHGDDNQDREWIWEVPDPLDTEKAEHSK